MSKQIGWDVLVGDRVIDVVFYESECDEEYVRRTLIDHDGYPAGIRVRQSEDFRASQTAAKMLRLGIGYREGGRP